LAKGIRPPEKHGLKSLQNFFPIFGSAMASHFNLCPPLGVNLYRESFLPAMIKIGHF
jgi:hypothetical protein